MYSLPGNLWQNVLKTDDLSVDNFTFLFNPPPLKKPTTTEHISIARRRQQCLAQVRTPLVVNFDNTYRFRFSIYILSLTSPIHYFKTKDHIAKCTPSIWNKIHLVTKEYNIKIEHICPDLSSVHSRYWTPVLSVWHTCYFLVNTRDIPCGQMPIPDRDAKKSWLNYKKKTRLSAISLWLDV